MSDLERAERAADAKQPKQGTSKLLGIRLGKIQNRGRNERPWYAVATALHPKQRGLLQPQQVSFAVQAVRRLFIGNQNDTADNDQNYSCKFRKGELFTKQAPDHHSCCNSPSNTNGSTNRDR
jgi:hypothetical protein